MSAIIDQQFFATKYGADEYLQGRGFVYVEFLNQYVDSGNKWATLQQMPSGKWLVKIGVSTR